MSPPVADGTTPVQCYMGIGFKNVSKPTNRPYIDRLAHAQKHAYTYALLCTFLSDIMPHAIAGKKQCAFLICTV